MIECLDHSTRAWNISMIMDFYDIHIHPVSKKTGNFIDELVLMFHFHGAEVQPTWGAKGTCSS